MSEEPLENALKQLQTKYSEVPFAINVQNLSDKEFTYRKVLNVDQFFHDTFEPVAKYNPLPSIYSSIDLGSPFRSQQFVSKEDVHPDYVGSFIEPNNNIERSIGMIINRHKHTASYINICLPEAVSESDEKQLFQEIQYLQPYFRNAFQLALQRRMRETISLTKDLGKFWLEQMPYSALIVDENAQVQEMNARAENLLSDHANLGLCANKCITAKASADASALESKIKQSLQLGQQAEPVVVNNEYGPNTLIYIQPTESKVDAPSYLSSFLVKPQYCLLMIFDPTDFIAVPDDMVSYLLNLTPKETQVVRALTNGASTREAAEQLGISYNTTRNHIANVSRRLGASSQSEIVRLVMTTLSRYPWPADTAC
ncbi:response regulator FixJ [Pseudovibrio axinellae]|uniref:Response regulator FixJ n=2 Tax=Pseudovibrio axinellae TaxID=989403 RepID=A0A165VTW2_9HYPH|nr:response regulator FixJ [Pseudovibrio axinellae]SER56392.1 regulatory protein, luxR family [Pseudovibrio axinellae]